MLQQEIVSPLKPEEPLAALPATGRIHLVGVAGSGMRALADMLLGLGRQVSGSDASPDPLLGLVESGLRLWSAHDASHVGADVKLVVRSDAIPADNPELRHAAEAGIPVLSYFELLGRLMTERHGLAIAGTHGKSTATAMAAQILIDAGLDPTVLCGAAPLGRSSGGRFGHGRHLLVEACEYRANFLRLAPRHAVILGIEPDHFDYYPSQAELEQAFAWFADGVAADGLLLARHDCLATRRVTAAAASRVATFGTAPEADWSAQKVSPAVGRYSFAIYHCGRRLADVQLQVPGRHNVLNALAAAALAWENGVAPKRIATSLGRFRGLQRRFEVLGAFRGVTFVDDYAHLPTEIAATLETARQAFPGRRLVCVFQPHQASRTTRLLDELARSLQNADLLAIADIFRAREAAAKPGEATAADLAAGVSRSDSPPEIMPQHALEEIAAAIPERLKRGDVLLTLGAGDIRRIFGSLMQM